jgi:hypothetical protein
MEEEHPDEAMTRSVEFPEVDEGVLCNCEYRKTAKLISSTDH